jgi:AcrR family transcriptional regulator
MSKSEEALADAVSSARSGSASGVARKGARRRKATREEKSERIRKELFRAAAEIVGEVGYAGASITLITQRAGVAQGTFYNYFESRQDVLDKLLPELGEQMRRHIREAALQAPHNFAELERRGFEAFFGFLKENPHFLRILNEAESYALAGYQKHFDATSKEYVRFLARAQRNGEFPGYDEDELEAVAFILMAARSYLAVRYLGQHTNRRRPNKLPPAVVDTYMKFVLHGLQGGVVGGARRARERGDKSGR